MTKAIVVGGGIGGLAAALALRRVGVEVVVFERAAELREVGAGVSLWANAVRSLRALGVYGEVREAGVELGGEIRTWKGRLLGRIPARELKRRFGDTNIALHRADLQRILLDALPEGAVHAGAALVGFEQDDGRVVANLSDGREHTGDLLLGADGLRSAVRARLHGEERPRYAGYSAWRGISRSAGHLTEGDALNLWGRGGEFGMAGIGAGRLYWFFTRNAVEGEAEGPSGRKAEVLEGLEGAYEPARKAVQATAEADILRNDVYDREPLQRWGEGRATLLGDAAHPMTPNMGQGACQALEDAVALADALREEPEAVRALRLYEARRTEPTAQVVRRSRLLGRVAQVENPLLCTLRDAAAWCLPTVAQVWQNSMPLSVVSLREWKESL